MRQWFSGLALGLMVGGCNAIIDVSDKQCNTNDDCVRANIGTSCVAHLCVDDTSTSPDGKCTKDAECASSTPRCMNGSCVTEEVAERWICKDEQPTMYSGTISVKFKVLEFVSRKAPKNLTVQACAQNDIGCGAAVAEFMDTDGTGEVELELPAGFLGYFFVKSSETLDVMSYLTKPLYEDTVERDLQVPAPTTINLLASASGVEYQPTKGLALVEAFDCANKPAGGVHFTESKGMATPFYFVNRLPTKDATVSVYDPNNDLADGGFVNIPADFVTFSAYLGVDGPLLGKVNVQVRPSTAIYIDMHF